MLVLDVADNFLEQVLERDQPIGSAIFIHDDRHMTFLAPHLEQQVEDLHGRRNEQHGPEHARQCETLIARHHGKQVLDVQEALHVVERFAVNRNARMSLLKDVLLELIKRHFHRHA